MKKKYIIGILSVVVFLVCGCDLPFNGVTGEEVGVLIPQDGDENTIKGRVYNNAVYFVNNQTEYKLGASGRTVYPFDCSGLVIRCYHDALDGSGLCLPFEFNNSSHPSAQKIHDKYSLSIDNPEKGDLIFLNYNRNNPSIGHIGIFVRKDRDGTIHFIDATDYSGYDKVVDFRTLKSRDKAFRGFGEMIIH